MGERAAIHLVETPTTANPPSAAAEVWVRAIQGGWSVGASFIGSPMVFRSGARAEQAARRLAEAGAKAGLTVELNIQTRDGRLARQSC